MTRTREVDLPKETYFHGLIAREDVPELVSRPGDYIVRMSEPNEGATFPYVLSVCGSEVEKGVPKLNHYQIKFDAAVRTFCVDSRPFASIQDLVRHYQTTGEAVSAKVVAYLKTPIPRAPWELARGDVALGAKLGEGSFGSVHEAKWTRADGSSLAVAVKLAKVDKMTKMQIRDVLNEARLQRSFSHINIAILYAVVALEFPIMLVLELVSDGALHQYLKSHEHTTLSKADMCRQAASGLAYMHAANVIHRDVAARNCLYGNGHVKIGDFGMSRMGPVYKLEEGGRISVRWHSPETLRDKISTVKSDVYSYGVLCWEIMHNCKKEPYGGLPPLSASEEILCGHLLEFSPPIPDLAKRIIQDYAWNSNPAQRWEMAKLGDAFFNAFASEVVDFGSQYKTQPTQLSSIKMTGKGTVRRSASRSSNAESGRSKSKNTARRVNKGGAPPSS